MKPNILFVSVPAVSYSILQDYFGKRDIRSLQLHGEPLGLLYLSSYLKQFKIHNQISLLDYALGLLNAHKYDGIDHYIRQLAVENVDYTPDIIGISINFTCSHKFLLNCSRTIKNLWPNSVIVVGGFHATNATHEVLSCPAIDYVLRGEGEIGFTEFVRQWTQGRTKNNYDINGLYNEQSIRKSQDTVTIQSQDTVTIHKLKYDEPLSSFGLTYSYGAENLDSLPFPDRTLIDMKSYAIEKGRTTVLSSEFARRKASIITNRGCHYACTFCASRTVFPRKMRFRSTKNVIDEVRQLNSNYGINFIVIEDDLFTGNNKKCLDILKSLKEIKEKEIPDLEIQFPNDLNINTVNEEIFDAMIDCGLRVAHISVESGSQYVQDKVINKRAKLSRLKPFVNYLQDKGVIVKLVFILGFPGETKELMRETIDFARNMKADWCIFNIATPLLGTPMYDQFVKKGYITKDIDVIGDIDFKIRNFDTDEITAEALNDLAYEANLDINFLNNRKMQQGQYSEAVGMFKEILSKYHFHIFGLVCLRKCYLKLGKIQELNRVQDKIEKLVFDNTDAKQMIQKFGHLIPDLSQIVFGIDRR